MKTCAKAKLFIICPPSSTKEAKETCEYFESNGQDTMEECIFYKNYNDLGLCENEEVNKLFD